MMTAADVKKALAIVTEKEVMTLPDSTPLEQLGINSFGLSEFILEIEAIAGMPLNGTPVAKMRRFSSVRTIADLTQAVNELLRP